MSDTPILKVSDLIVEFPVREGTLRPVDRVGFEVRAGEILGLVGESGAGKSMCGSAIIGLIERPGRISGGEIRLHGERIDNLPEDDMRRIRGKRIAMVFQDPLTSLNPLMTVGKQLTETIRAHLAVSSSEARSRAVALLEEVGIPAAASRIDAYPHQFSGGMRQRVVIALALAAEPELIIADEPTTALDVSVQAQIMALLKKLCRERGTAVILITHDMGVIAETTDRVAVLYAGRIAEIGPTRAVLSTPSHPYTIGLMASTPSTTGNLQQLSQIPGSMPNLRAIPKGCAFNPRCTKTISPCFKDIPILETVDGSEVACWLYDPAYKADTKEETGASQ
ncbi:MAG: ABC transporter ATP-binding protein [Roseibium sp.]|uniref:ABC transporter ATP-binding protein n=1 Tax=Roseibium sp. TaxID=1936156 RepID=UPI001B00EA65|nr:ABC transporter ATP-binding protein [Roseibium sp.]MBO6894807.1 ABC transporter ATP-binding protein [Roseibium sp.]MBO6930380.1 ABC transporter ATP-binding protein [Roseibium sp.]